ncbi:Stk1 family PASTA domain-containing Ser/Thr kinase [Gordonia pseudamarae]|jgi:beta-lactam-binding protein with PASTA domain/predicted Ser/Thr protein kinase|uniref:non-specific serine/threonine protein kinase n=1 Tax=Gordonia pseudamarae TaxID=2831662 RepID=A0ABX6IE57_9ACTN|nr:MULTISPECIES: Stk1 family PASTA domain-containing Ser/Thr kinase [Gordonia]MBD0024246.1 Stk1 family PASTA domain-containing Ser/Thr kinase [Gordonia sp. (in: high G+C Gram-positive bacteria)]QHN24634.1 Stk1 family PASTA domain-containing Ser/Thr kinase [Gordonia pseudamarae]QHN33565.1 Stk1 family PASTA domain-containing Ser/Thr kinase [Gordonia pseudamarae]
MTSTPHHLSNRYELGETLGFGGMSEVHFARDTLLNRDVAVKVLRADLARDPSFYLRFRREAQNAAKLNHPTIVQVFDTGESQTEGGPLPFIVMEYVDGKTLRDILRSEGPLSPRQVMTWMADVAAAMDFSHRNGIVHRDMKPANVMIDITGAVKVMDFGIARAMNDSTSTMTQTSAVMGTAQYLSPEQARGIKVDPRSDIYSMGCVLFELLTGQPPFTGDSPVAVAHQHVHEEPPRPSSIRTDLSPELDSVILKAMSKNPANRYQSAADLRADLIKVLAGGKPSAPMLLSEEERTDLLDTGPRRGLRTTGRGGADRGTGGVEQVDESPDRRRPLLVLGALAAVLVLVAGILVFWAPWSSDEVPQVAVPAVDGRSADEARSLLETAGFKVKRLGEASLDVAAGKVTRTAPGPGIKADDGSEVTLYVSTGPQRQPIPDLRGKTQDEAENALDVLGFSNVKLDTVDSTEELRDRVVSTTPPTGTETPVNGAVVIYIGTGPKMVTIPEINGLSESQARVILEQNGLQMTTTQADSEVDKGDVINSAPSAGTTVIIGTTVEVTISRGNRYTVPDVTGRTPAQARTILSGVGYEGGRLEVTYRNVPLGSRDDGRILSQSPSSGTRTDKNEQVSVVVGRASLLPN